MSALLVAPFSFSAGSMIADNGGKDFNMTDFYSLAANSRPVRELDKDILIVDIENKSRSEITDLIELLPYLNLKGAALDVTFNELKDSTDDARLLKALLAYPSIILAAAVSSSAETADLEIESQEYVIDDYSFFYPQTKDSLLYGAVNLPTKYVGGTIRNFPEDFKIKGGGSLPSFVTAIARRVDPQAAARLKSRGNFMEPIDFPSREFDVVTIDDLFVSPELSDGKILLIGALGEQEDIHSTPVSREMPGVLIHAYALSTVLRNSYYDVTPKWVNIIMAFLL